MTWLQWYRIRSYFRYSIWILPLFGMLAALGLSQITIEISERIGMQANAEPGAARDLLVVLASSIFTLIVFVSSALLLAVQLASAQLTPRVISLLFSDPITKFALTLFVFSFTFALSVAIRISDTVPAFATRVAAYGCLLSLAFFIFLIDHVGKFLRPSGILRVVARMGRQVIESVYPKPFVESAVGANHLCEYKNEEPTRTILNKKSGVILALDVDRLSSLAEKFDCLIEMAPQVGDFVAAEEPLFRIFRGGNEISDVTLLNLVAVGAERTMQQDPAFTFRILVDIASKGLSPAINDPTTAVLAIDQIHRLLREVGNRDLSEGLVRDSAGRLRFAYRTPDWEEFVQLAVTEIRQFGCTSIQIARRLRAMLENLIRTLPPARTKLLLQELSRLDRSAMRSFSEAEDRALAEVSDSQGVGGKPDQQ